MGTAFLVWVVYCVDWLVVLGFDLFGFLAGFLRLGLICVLWLLVGCLFWDWLGFTCCEYLAVVVASGV